MKPCDERLPEGKRLLNKMMEKQANQRAIEGFNIKQKSLEIANADVEDAAASAFDVMERLNTVTNVISCSVSTLKSLKHEVEGVLVSSMEAGRKAVNLCTDKYVNEPHELQPACFDPNTICPEQSSNMKETKRH